MGGGESKPEHVPENWSIYVSNETTGKKEIYVRLRGDKLQESENYSRILSVTSVGISGNGKTGQEGDTGAKEGGKGGINIGHKNEEEKKKREVYECLTQGGFSFLPQGEVMPFAVENSGRLMYISVHDGSRNWCWDMPVNPRQYGCVKIKEDGEGNISIFPSNPEPRWVRIDPKVLPTPSLRNAVKVHQTSTNVVVYVAKVHVTPTLAAAFPVLVSYEPFTGVWIENGKFSFSGNNGLMGFTVDLLFAQKCEWVKAQRGNIIPPNAVKTVSRGNHKEQYVGRIGGEKVCGVSITDGMITYFTDRKGCQTTSGEILLLTVDPSD